MKNSKKAEIHQVFIYLMVIIVVGTLMLVGYKAISGLLVKSCDVQLTDFKTQLRNSLSRNSNYGVSEVKAFRVPCDYEEICFINAVLPEDPTLFNLDSINYPQIRIEAEKETGRQIFLVKKGGVVEDINFVIDGLEVQDYYFCTGEKGSNFNIKMQGISKGRVLVSDPSAT